MQRYTLKLFTSFLLILVSGCLPSLDGLLDTGGIDTQPKYTDKVYLIGSLEGDLHDELLDFIDFTAYDGVSTDAPIVMAGSTVAETDNGTDYRTDRRIGSPHADRSGRCG
jgi:hypothetical protein